MHQALGDQPLQERQGLALVLLQHGCGRRERPAAGEDRERRGRRLAPPR